MALDILCFVQKRINIFKQWRLLQRKQYPRFLLCGVIALETSFMPNLSESFTHVYTLIFIPILTFYTSATQYIKWKCGYHC